MKTVLSFLAITSSVVAAAPQQTDFFENKIRPVLAQNCYECHSQAGKKKGGLLLDSRPGWQAGGESGPTIIPGDAKKSLLMISIRHEDADLEMPKAGAKLSDAVIADFAKWINDGAFDPRDKAPTKDELAKATDWKTVLEARKDWWSLKPVSGHSSLVIGDGRQGPNPVDVFINAKLKEQDLTPAPRADDATITRRLHYVLTGLPPTPDQVQSKISNLKSTIESLLASERFGEKWARHFMDWVRYAESYGSEGDPAIPYAWRYRDYLIRAFNSNVPYPQLVREAIAGDLLPQPRIVNGINESALGIAQLRMVLHGFSPVDSLDEMLTFTDNQIDTVSKAFQAMTVTCARCHNHKFDPISQTDFYAMYGIFTSTHPAVIDVNRADDSALRAEMKSLKQQLKQAVGKAWLASLPASSAVDPSSSESAKLDWFTSGKGVTAQPTPAGEFSIANEGTAIIQRIHPRGWFSDTLSTKDAAVMASARFTNPGGTLWVRCAGDGGARARYIVQNYPRTGTIHKAITLASEKDEALAWRSLDLEYWKGDEIFIQCTTAADMPVETKQDDRSWFGITDWKIVPPDGPVPPLPKPATNARAAVQAWIDGTITDAQAELLDQLLRDGKLTNDRRQIAEAEPLLAKYRALENRLPAPVRSPGVMEADATDRALFVQGNHKSPSEIVPRRFLEAIDPKPYNSKQSGRLELANSIADLKTNPLTARVIVNRLWHHIFGRGIVSTVDNFGRLGELPTHPELLDFLAQRFIDSGGDLKAMIELLVSSDTFLRNDKAPAGANEKDPDNKLLSRWTVRRLEAEAIRDSMLQLTGKLDLTMGGESVGGGDMRRSVYVKVTRNSLDPFLTVFDAPVPSSTRGKRDVTNVPAQSLTMLNDAKLQSWAKQWGNRTTGDDASRVKQMFSEAFGRAPTDRELKGSLAFVQSSAHGGDAQRSELAKLDDQLTSIRNSIERTLAPVRERLTKKLTVAKPTGNLPEPYAEWDFEDGPQDLKGHLPLTLNGNARIEHGVLILDGKSYARSVALPKDVKAKTLEAWVMLETLDQRGGGVITMQDNQGNVFDSIVFAEKAAHEWVPGSDFFNRSQLLGGPIEQEADKRPVHIACVYEADGRVSFYRDGQLYGKSYQSNGPAVFKEGDAHVQLGCRHGTGGGNKFLTGRILRSRVYDRALTADELHQTRLLEQSTISERDVIDALSSTHREAVKTQQAQLATLREQATKLRSQIESVGGEAQTWASLALSLVNTKEFVYLK
ncbi:MAG: DUF1553 domain-containing protein [Verrucomicrobiaceae bacterium]|nr:DUF1553 domain-containing protein [Verrucomicrobiaceae bacterium]